MFLNLEPRKFQTQQEQLGKTPMRKRGLCLSVVSGFLGPQVRSWLQFHAFV